MLNPTSITSYSVLVFSGFTILVIFIGIVFTFIKIKEKLRTSSNVMSEKTKTLQSQLTLVMTVHAIIPLVLTGLPLTFLIISALFNIDTNGYGFGHIHFMIVVWPNIFNPHKSSSNI
uniref:Cytochrome-c oxidase n=1 Tax=Rhabditophanes sp. KR3021 TaxID=114890 RepID=A0AC35TQ88_9BILA